MKTIAAIVTGTGFEGRAARIRAFCRNGAKVRLVREPRNPHDPNAIRVDLQVPLLFGLIRLWGHIGYIKAPRAARMAPQIDDGSLVILSARVDSFDDYPGVEHPRVSLRIDVKEKK
jgi:hypothetical protein